MKHVHLEPVREVSAFRRMAIGTWAKPVDPSIYGALDLRVDRVLDYMKRFRRATRKPLTMNHMVIATTARALAEMPDANGLLRFERLYRRRDIDIAFQVFLRSPIDGQPDLTVATVRRVDQLSLPDLVDAAKEASRTAEHDLDPVVRTMRERIRATPGLLMRGALRAISFVQYSLNLDLVWAGVPRDAFGSVLVTNVGFFGLEEAYVPLQHFSRVPIQLAVGKVRKVAEVDDDGRVGVARRMKLCATFDHRIIDGYHAAVMSRVFERCFADPEACFGPVPRREAKGREQAEPAASRDRR